MIHPHWTRTWQTNVVEPWKNLDEIKCRRSKPISYIKPCQTTKLSVQNQPINTVIFFYSISVSIATSQACEWRLYLLFLQANIACHMLLFQSLFALVPLRGSLYHVLRLELFLTATRNGVKGLQGPLLLLNSRPRSLGLLSLELARGEGTFNFFFNLNFLQLKFIFWVCFYM